MSAITPDEIKALYEPFDVSEHEIREGSRSKSGKVQWFVYISWAAIQRRLDTIFPAEWETRHIETYRDTDYVAITLALVIRGVMRVNNGGSEASWNSKAERAVVTHDDEKGAMTDAFRRVATRWGIGLYLQDSPQFWTDGYEKGQWDVMRTRQDEAWHKFEDWYHHYFGIKPAPQNARQNAPQATKTRETAPQRENTRKAPENAQNGEKSWRKDTTAFWTQVFPLYDSNVHARNSVSKLAEDGQLPDNLTVDQAVAVVREHVGATDIPM